MPALLILGVFFMQAVVVYSLYPRLPDIQARLASDRAIFPSRFSACR